MQRRDGFQPSTHDQRPKAGSACSDIRGPVQEGDLADVFAVIDEIPDRAGDKARFSVMAGEKSHAHTEVLAAVLLTRLTRVVIAAMVVRLRLIRIMVTRRKIIMPVRLVPVIGNDGSFCLGRSRTVHRGVRVRQRVASQRYNDRQSEQNHDSAQQVAKQEIHSPRYTTGSTGFSCRFVRRN